MLENPAAGADSDGGMLRIIASANSETAYESASRAKVAAMPSVAMQIPASAGPPIIAVVPRSVVSADTACSSPGATSRGVSDSSAGLWNPLTADITAATTNSTTTLGCGA